MPQETMNTATGSSQPENMNEFYRESFSHALQEAVGYYVTCEFLIGTSNLVVKSGIIYVVGNNFISLEDPDTGNVTICDIYSLKFATIYETRSRSENLPQQRPGMGGNIPSGGGRWNG